MRNQFILAAIISLALPSLSSAGRENDVLNTLPPRLNNTVIADNTYAEYRPPIRKCQTAKYPKKKIIKIKRHKKLKRVHF